MRSIPIAPRHLSSERDAKLSQGYPYVGYVSDFVLIVSESATQNLPNVADRATGKHSHTRKATGCAGFLMYVTYT